MGPSSRLTMMDWTLAPEGAAVHEGERTAVIADVHLGYEWARARGGDCVPPHSLRETLERIGSLLARVEIDRLVVAGDLVESSRYCPRTANDVQALRAFLEGHGVEFVWIRGNHDPLHRPALPSRCEVGGWTVSHGDRKLKKGRAIFGHHHPVLKADGLVAPCFLIGPTTLALPAFSPNAAGLDVLGNLPEPLRREPLRCVAVLGESVLDFGPIEALHSKLRIHA